MGEVDRSDQNIGLYRTSIRGCSTVGGAFTPDILKQMAKNCKRPIIFALSNPTHKAECTPQQAYDNTEGRCIYASGSPFPPVKYGGKEYRTGQGNNCYIFPGVALGLMSVKARHVPDKMFLVAAKTLAKMISEHDLALGRLYPPLNDLQTASFNIGIEVAKLAYEMNLAATYPPPDDMRSFIKGQSYNLDYEEYAPQTYDYPPMPKIRVRSYQEELRRIKNIGDRKGKQSGDFEKESLL